MTMLDAEIKSRKDDFPAGARVKLIKMKDDQAPDKGTLGTVKSVDDIGTVHIKWDNGSSLGAVMGVDIIEKVEV